MLGFLDDLDDARLREICDQHWPETQTLEFKRGLPSNDDKGKHEFLKDVCGLANADGGDLVFGISEDNGEASGVEPISTEPPDAVKRRLRQILDSGIQPRLNGVQFVEVRVNGGYVLVVRVPTSFDGPHRFMFNSHHRFVMRNDTHVTDLSYDQLRVAFDRSATLSDRARSFRQARLNSILDSRTPRSLIGGPLWVVHLIPLASMGDRRSIDVRLLYHDYARFALRSWSTAFRALNLDGLAVHSYADKNGAITGYTQVFRSGAIECVEHAGDFDEGTSKSIPAILVSASIREAITKLIGASATMGFAGPAILGAALIRIDGYIFAVSPTWRMQTPIEPRERNLVFPETWIENIASITDPNSVARPVLDILWQSFGVERCMAYSEDGVWRNE